MAARLWKLLCFRANTDRQNCCYVADESTLQLSISDGENYLPGYHSRRQREYIDQRAPGQLRMLGGLLLQKAAPVKVNIVMVDQERQQIKQYLESVMQDRNLHIIAIKDDFSHIYEISNALKNNELVAIHADRYVQGSKTISGNFLGEEANFPIGPFVLATTFKVPVSYVFCVREKGKHYHLYATPPVEYAANKQVAIPAALADYTKELEAKVKQYPGNGLITL